MLMLDIFAETDEAMVGDDDKDGPLCEQVGNIS